MDLDFLSSLLDEVALEGLDGITLPMLWIRLENRPNFPIALDDDSKVFLWECTAVHKDIEIFELPKPRKLVPIYNRYEHIDSDLGIVVESTEKIIDSYPIAFVKDGDIRGSCETYEYRVNITSEIRYDDVLLMALGQVTEKWGECLVLVASPKARLLALIGTEANPLMEMSQEEYCLLERIGRSRYLGEVTQGEGGLLSLKAPFCKQLHYYRKKLTLKGLVTKQLHYLKRKGQATTGSLFHLTRFYVQRKTKMELLMKCMCDILKEKPYNRETCRVLREEMNIKENTFKKLFYRPFHKWVKIINLPHREFYPQATTKESFTANGQERMLKAVQLLRHCDDGDNEDEEINEEKEQVLPLNVYFDASKIYHDLPLMSQVYRLIQDAGPEGMTSAALGRIITLPRLDVRTLLKSLIKKDLIVTVLQERGRQKETKYIAKSYGDQNEAYSKIKEKVGQFSHNISNAPEKNKESLKRKANQSELHNNETPSRKRVRFNNEVTFEESEGREQNAKLDFQKIVSEVSEIQSNKEFTGKAPKLISLTEKVQTATRLSNSNQLTLRKLQRINTTLDHLKSSGYTTLTDLQKLLTDKEKEEGYSYKLDKKSTARMVHNLYLTKKLKIFKGVLTMDDQKTEMEFICDNSVEPTDPRIQVAIEQAKFKFFSNTKDKQKKPDKDAVNAAEVSDKFNIEKRVLYESQMHPKFLRFRTLHKFLFYLVYQYEGQASDSSGDPVVYHNSMTWKRFVPPLPSDRKEGWCFLADVYARMPLSIFVKVVNLRQRIKEFSEYVIHEEKSHYLITYLPQNLLNSLLSNRRYLFAVDDVMKSLCYMGLITFGPQVAKFKEQVYIYVHKKATVKDTTISTPGYLHINPNLTYEKRLFSFNTLADVDQFWMELESISFHTQLGKYSAVAGETIAVPEANHKPELLESLKRKSFNEVTDVGHIPGDGLGAGGFDSSLFLHSRRNWQSPNITKGNEKANKLASNANPSISIQNLLKNREALGPESCNRLQRLARYRLASQKDKTLKDNVVKKSKAEDKNKSDDTVKKNKVDASKSPPAPIIPKKRKRIKFRTVKVRNKKIRTPYFDEKDKAAIEKMSRARCEWSAQEDSFLLLCKVASSFLDPTSRTLVVPYTVVRDLLHEKFPELSANKSSRACQRRVRYMMLNPTTTSNVAVFLGEAKQDINLVKEFDKVKPVKTNEAVWKELFTGVLKKLLEKFTLPAAHRCRNITLPESLEVFRKSFEIMSPRNVFHRKNNHKDPENEDEVKYSTLYSLIVSAMAIIHDGTEWSYLLYKLYQVYPEYVLRSVVSRLRSEKVIAIKKRTCKKDLQRSLMSTFPYRFSITYENTMLTKFPIKLFNESKELLDSLKYLNDKEGMELKGDTAPGYTGAILALVSLDQLSLTVQVPEQIILFDTSLSEEARSTIVERMIHTLSDKESVELSRLLNNDKESLLGNSNDQNSSQRMNEEIVNNQSQDNFKKKPEEESTQHNEIQRSTNASRFALYLLRQELSQPPIERVQHSQDYIVLNSCKIFCHLKSQSDCKESVCNSEMPSSSSSSNQTIPCLNKNINDYRGKILTDGCISEIKASLTSYISPGAFTQHQNFEEALEMIYDAYSPQTLSDAKFIFDDILKGNVIGILEKTLWEKFRLLSGELSLFEHLHLFREALLVVRAGVASFLYVCICYAKNWVLTSYVMPDMCYRKKYPRNTAENFDYNSSRNEDDSNLDTSQKKSESLQITENSEISVNKEDNNCTMQDVPMEDLTDQGSAICLEDPAIAFTDEVYFLPRTWRHPDGSLNKTVFVELLQTILSYVISSPGINVSRVTERFSLALQPVQTLELLEILEKACCIVKYYCKKPKKRTLFSPPITVSFTRYPEPEDLDHLEPLPDAVCNLARLQEAIM